MSEDTAKLNPSKLGTKQYWDDFYNLETKNFESNNNDTGENWFDDSDAEYKMCEFLSDQMDIIPSVNINSRIVDVGTGNGHLLISLREEGFEGELVGLDYSQTSVEFARKVAENKGVDAVFERVDLLADESYLQNVAKFDIVCDKGTLDAIALSDEIYNGRTGVEKYAENVRKFMKTGSILLITSCNFTEEELTKIIMNNNTDLQKWKLINYPSFQFGGVKGSTIVSIAFIMQ